MTKSDNVLAEQTSVQWKRCRMKNSCHLPTSKLAESKIGLGAAASSGLVGIAQAANRLYATLRKTLPEELDLLHLLIATHPNMASQVAHSLLHT